MTFVSAAFLFAAAAGAIPVVLHMINRQQAKKLPFSTLRFLRISAEKTRRRKRIHDVLLMLLRTAVLVLIALGLAEPTMTTLGSFWGSGASAVVIIFDNSASMGVFDDGRPRLETARGAAREIMDELADGDQIGLMLTGGPQFAEQGQLVRAQDKILQMLDQVQTSYQRADMAVVLQDARNLLAETDSNHKRIFILTDMQAVSWEGLRESEERSPLSQASEADDEEIAVIFVDCNRNPKPNVAVTELEVTAEVPVTGLSISASAELFNASSVPQKRLAELYIDGAKHSTSPELEIPPSGKIKHDFQFAFSRGGIHQGEVRLVGEDGSRYDDQRFFSIEVDQEIPVAIVKPQNHEIPYLEDSFYLEQVLAPGPVGGSSAIHPTILTADELLSEPLSQYKVVFCVNLPAPNPAAPDAEEQIRNMAELLRNYVASGGNLFWIAGDNVNPEAYNKLNEVANNQILPARLGEVRLPLGGEDRDSWYIASLDGEDPVMRHLDEPASVYQSVLVYKHIQMDTAAAPEARVLARLDDGEALLAQARVERGTVTTLATSAQKDWSNLPVGNLFLPLVYLMTYELAGAEQARYQALAGSPITMQMEYEIQPVMVEIRPPSSSGAVIQLKSQPVKGRAGQELIYDDTYAIGVYTLKTLEPALPFMIAYSVNFDPDEADPKTITHEEMEELLGGTPVLFAENPDDMSSTFRKLREGESFWELALAGVLLTLVFETFISNMLNPAETQRGSPMENYGSLPVRKGFGYKSQSRRKAAE